MDLPDGVTAEQFLEAVRQGVSRPDVEFYDTVKAAIKEGIENSMPFSDQITNAITDGIKEAHRGF